MLEEYLQQYSSLYLLQEVAYFDRLENKLLIHNLDKKIEFFSNFEGLSLITFGFISKTPVKTVFNSKHSKGLKFFASARHSKFIFVVWNTENRLKGN